MVSGLLAGQQPIVQFDYKTEADCNTSENCPERAARRCDGTVLVRADPEA